ncbi:cytochrome c oxidase copper chaperone protein [Hyaloscypha hepaticicola]|uniref:Cytochrome c oxidase copper chaperone protein n=1 Tax=Hyaloscypha hepaticicola TaxID=2082293 RepID=A0A2J6QK18_9HELO|nr:cytochrome c oxidase copper chaperone protein [Hyaloscypha hepaticicola]
MYYYQSLQAADTEHSMASKFISMPPATATGANMGQDVKPAGEAAAKVKPCCVCKDEKASRDECMLFSNAKDPQKDCASTIDKYKSCMAGFGFQLP